MIRTTTAQSRETLQQILELQARNLAAHLSPAEAAGQGSSPSATTFRYAKKYLSPDGESWEIVTWERGRAKRRRDVISDI
jgi:predicted lactoylglutathione lyase